MKTYRFLEHATDAIIETKSDTIENAFLAAADAVVNLTIDKNSVNEKESITFKAYGENLHYLLYSWLEEIIYVLITQGFAIRRITIDGKSFPESMLTVPVDVSSDTHSIDAHSNDNSTQPNINHDSLYICAKAFGEPIDLHRHGFKVEIKAPTFHDMVIEKNRGYITMRFLLDL